MVRLKKMWNQRSSQGFLLLIEFKFLIMTTSALNIERKRAMLCGLVIIIKNLNSINSRRPWLPLLILHLFTRAFLILSCYFFTPRVFLVVISLLLSLVDGYMFECFIRVYQFCAHIYLELQWKNWIKNNVFIQYIFIFYIYSIFSIFMYIYIHNILIL